MTFGSDGRPDKRSLSQCHGINDPSPAYGFRFTPVGTYLPFSKPRCQKGCDPAPQSKNGGISLWSKSSMSAALNTDSRALAWPRPPHNQTCVPRRPQHRPGSQASYKSWRHPSAPRLPPSRCHIPASTPKIAAQNWQRPGGITRERGILKEAAARPGTPPTKPHPDLGPGPGSGPAP